MEISWQLDPEFDADPIDPIDPMGSFIISEGNTKISTECVYIDSIFYSLAKGILMLKSSASYSSDVIDELNSINFNKVGEAVVIEYENQKVSIPNINEAKKAIFGSFNKFKEETYGTNRKECEQCYIETENIIQQFGVS